MLVGVADDFAWRVPSPPGNQGPTLALTVSGCLLGLTLGELFPGTRLPGAFALLSVIILQPLLEELIFRGFLLSRLLRYTGCTTGRFAAITLQALGFSLLHAAHHAPVWAALIMVPGLVFGWLRVRHDSVLPAVAVHIAYNAAYCLPSIVR